ncbi:MAG: efflux RND transporter periplasmic adaptor subunit [Polyangiaceae bacterium]
MLMPMVASSKPKRARDARASRRYLRWGAWLTVLTVVILGTWWLRRSRANEPIGVQTIRIERGNVRDFVTSVAAGRVSGAQETTVRAEIAGTVSVIHRRRGSKVRAGEALFEYAPKDLIERLRLASTSVTVAQAQVRQADQNAAVVETNLTRARRLLEANAIPSAEVDSLEGQSKVMQRSVEASRAAVQQALANVEIARSAVGKTIVRAPFDATVLDVKVEIGEITSPGAPVVLLADTSALHVDAEIDEADLARVRVGMPADVSFDALPNERIRGKLSFIAPSVTRDPRGGRSIAVEVALPEDPRLRVGMSADVDVIVAVRENTLWAPPNAVLGRGADRSVYVVEKGVAHKRTIDVGISTWEAVEIKSGLREGESVITTLSAAKLTDGARVTLLPGSRP